MQLYFVFLARLYSVRVYKDQETSVVHHEIPTNAHSFAPVLCKQQPMHVSKTRLIQSKDKQHNCTQENFFKGKKELS